MVASGLFVLPLPRHTSHSCRPRPPHVPHLLVGSTAGFGRSRRSEPTSLARLASSLSTTRRGGDPATHRPKASRGGKGHLAVAESRRQPPAILPRYCHDLLAGVAAAVAGRDGEAEPPMEAAENSLPGGA